MIDDEPLKRFQVIVTERYVVKAESFEAAEELTRSLRQSIIEGGVRTKTRASAAFGFAAADRTDVSTSHPQELLT